MHIILQQRTVHALQWMHCIVIFTLPYSIRGLWYRFVLCVCSTSSSTLQFTLFTTQLKGINWVENNISVGVKYD